MKPERLRTITVEGFRPEEIVALPDDQVHEYVFRGDPVVFRVAELEIQGVFRREADRLVATLTRIEPGGEAIVPSITALLSRYARMRQIAWIEWEVQADGRGGPDSPLGQLLQGRGFTLAGADGPPLVYRLRQKIDS